MVPKVHTERQVLPARKDLWAHEECKENEDREEYKARLACPDRTAALALQALLDPWGRRENEDQEDSRENKA